MVFKFFRKKRVKSSNEFFVIYLIEKFEQNPEYTKAIFKEFLIENCADETIEEIDSIADCYFTKLINLKKAKKEKYLMPYLELYFEDRKADKYMRIICLGLLKHWEKAEDYICKDPSEMIAMVSLCFGLGLLVQKCLREVGYETYEKALAFCKKAVSRELVEITLIDSVYRFVEPNAVLNIDDKDIVENSENSAYGFMAGKDRVVSSEDFVYALHEYKQELRKIGLVNFMKESFILTIATYQALAFFQNKGFLVVELPSNKIAQEISSKIVREIYGIDFGIYRESKRVRVIDVLLVDTLIVLIRDYL